MTITEVTDESKCCCSCRHNKRTKCETDGVFADTLCNCEKDGHYIGYIQNFEQTCKEWEEEIWEEDDG